MSYTRTNKQDNFAAFVELQMKGNWNTDMRNWDAGKLCDYIIDHHHEYSKRALSTIADHLKSVLKIDSKKHPEVAAVCTEFYNLKEGFENHMMREEMILFPFIKATAKKEIAFSEANYSIQTVRSEYKKFNTILAVIRKETKNFTPDINSSPTLKLAYAELFNFEQDLQKQMFIENEILFPKIGKFEKIMNAKENKKKNSGKHIAALKKILVPTDFSENAGNAAAYALELARLTGAELTLMHAYHVPATEIPLGKMPPDMEMISKEGLKKLEIKIKKKSKIKTKIIVRSGFAADEIPDVATSTKTDLIIMGIRGTGRLEEAIIGSTATATIQNSLAPILVIPDSVSFKKPERIVFACDFHEADGSVLNVLTNIVRLFNARLYILNLLKTQEASEYEKAKKGIQLENYLKDTEHLYYFQEEEDITEGLNRFIKKHNIDMVIMIPHKHSVLERLFSKSNTKKMAFHTHVPLLAIPEKTKTVPIYFF